MPGPKLGGNQESREPGQVHFHYNREERVENLSRYAQRVDSKPRGVFRGNRSLVILLVDILLIVIIYVMFSIFGGFSSTSKYHNGYSFTLKAFEHDKQVFVSLKVTARRPVDSLESELVETVFYLSRNGIENEEVEILPEKRGAVRVLRTTFRPERNRNTAYANVRFLDDEILLKTQIKKE